MINQVLDSINFNYKVSEIENEEVKVYKGVLEIEDERDVKVFLIEDYGSEALTILVPEIRTFEDSDRCKVFELINDMNWSYLYGAIYISENNKLNFKITHSLSNRSKLTKSQLRDYIRMIYHAVVNIDEKFLEV